MITLLLGWPPSVNAIWRNVSVGGQSRTLLSAKGREYFAGSAALVQRQRYGWSVTGRALVEIELHPPTRAACDIDNRCKALLDALTKGGIWADDSQVDVMVVKRGAVKKGGMAVVTVSEIRADEIADDFVLINQSKGTK